ncbi:MAG: ribonuclease P protein component [Chloroflexota bacterium]|nr:ribonuclease P protein component [Chloroflexota bacterium]
MRTERLNKSRDFICVFDKGGSQVNKLLVMKSLPNGREETRCGFVVSKRVGKAVTRNRVRRLLRESVHAASVEPGWDIVFIARGVASTASYDKVKNSTHELLRRAGLLKGASVGQG